MDRVADPGAAPRAESNVIPGRPSIMDDKPVTAANGPVDNGIGTIEAIRVLSAATVDLALHGRTTLCHMRN
jgi:hypothetical protein